MALLYRGLVGSQFMYWIEGTPTPEGISNYTIVGDLTGEESSAKIITPITVIAKPTRINAAGFFSVLAAPGVAHEIGGFYFDPKEHGIDDVRIRTILSTITESNTASVKIYNATFNDYVAVDEQASLELSTTSSIPTAITSVNLANSKNFSVSCPCVYILHLYGNGQMPITLHYNTEIITQ